MVDLAVGLGASRQISSWGGQPISSWGITSWGAPQSIHLSSGFGASGASQFTVAAAKALDVYLTTHGCTGCDDLKSQLRQLTFAFKGACLTDPSVANSVNLNMSTPLAMTGFGPGSNDALSLVLGNERISVKSLVQCTDDNGNCVQQGFPTPQIPGNLQTLAQGVIDQINTLISQHQTLPPAQQVLRQDGLLQHLMTIGGGLLNQLGFELQKLQPTPQAELPPKMVIDEVDKVAPTTPTTTTTTAPKKDLLKTFLIGGVAATSVLGAALLVYYAMKKKRA